MKKLFVISGPSGAGLGEVIGRIFASRSDVASVLPVTARKMKAGEQDGVGFRFYDLEGWEQLKASGDLLEQTVFAGNDYGTSRALVEELLQAGKNVLLNVEADRAAQIKKNMPEAVCVYVEPENLSVLEARYRENARSVFEVPVRLQEAAQQRALSGFCDVRIASDDLGEAEAKLCRLIDEAE